jgi:hypothetical protein
MCGFFVKVDERMKTQKKKKKRERERERGEKVIKWA